VTARSSHVVGGHHWPARTSDDTRAALEATPLAEARRPAAITSEIAGIAPMVVGGADRFAWNDGGGQSAVWYFPPYGRALLLTFDHEMELNLYAEGDYALQESLYSGVPEDLVRLVRDRPENYESLNLVEEDTGRAIHYAGGVFWFDGDQWRAADGLVAFCKQRGLDRMKRPSCSSSPVRTGTPAMDRHSGSRDQ
jgi:hypothetical protein